ncbi:twin-arginine translocation signal domain-containing protein [Sediminicurvatus halobius]|uniref:Tat (Twin-arginine translocation) pathway signal sequence n=1 Tax=Sediminicurvatus halobius TaxID=2182432 RepID=A0A2U2N6S0_9GAMM|nr:twin-arginine translocation signal domain-containing protein [Spiribacter halobius]PWG64876.1 tat (twin-arginine translocation) pathway signal sequence [Spiribacter halobius]UEX78269.1 twin-arginine translocation signal domain-containing protein [Spiribacter halobius]
MLETAVSRRDFLRGSGAALMGVLAFAGGPIAALAPSRAWALELTQLSERQGRALLTLTRHIFPHDTMEDAVYAFVVRDLDAAAAADDATDALIRDGLARLDDAAGGDWLGLDGDEQFVHVRAMAGSPFFEKVRSTAVVSLYDNELAYAHFGYEGPSFQKGGYLMRGFDDLTWLPDPPESASPPMA